MLGDSDKQRHGGHDQCTMGECNIERKELQYSEGKSKRVKP